MLRDLRFVWVVALLALGLSLFLGVRLYAAQQEVAKARLKELTLQRMAEFAKNFQPANFVRADNTQFVYRVPEQVTVGTQVFVNAVEHTAKYGTDFSILGAILSDDPQSLSKLQAGSPIRVLIHNGDTIDAVYVLP